MSSYVGKVKTLLDFLDKKRYHDSPPLQVQPRTPRRTQTHTKHTHLRPYMPHPLASSLWNHSFSLISVRCSSRSQY